LTFLKEITEKALIGDRAYVAITDSNGTTIAHPNKELCDRAPERKKT